MTTKETTMAITMTWVQMMIKGMIHPTEMTA
jgi:hypothetical protein